MPHVLSEWRGITFPERSQHREPGSCPEEIIMRESLAYIYRYYPKYKNCITESLFHKQYRNGWNFARKCVDGRPGELLLEEHLRMAALSYFKPDIRVEPEDLVYSFKKGLLAYLEAGKKGRAGRSQHNP